MKKKRLFKGLIVLLITVLIIPAITYAKEFSIENTDIKVNLDDTKWYVFTRDNLENNKQLKELGIESSKLKNTMTEGNIYLDSIKFISDNEILELFVMKKPVSKVKNMSNYSDKDLKEIAKAIAKNENTSTYEIYTSDYKYIYTKYSDSGKSIIDYYTVINGYGYTIKLQKDSEFTSSDEKELKEIVNKISFNVNKSLKEPSRLSPIVKDAIIGAIVGGLAGATYSLVNKSKNKKSAK